MFQAANFILAHSDDFMHDGTWGGAWPWVMMIGMVLFWAVVIFGIVWLVRSSGVRGWLRRETPLEILDRRYARGEITEEEYAQRRRTLEIDAGLAGRSD